MADKTYLDLRIRKTIRAIRNAFIDLLAEKELNKISINAITQKAERIRCINS